MQPQPALISGTLVGEFKKHNTSHLAKRAAKESCGKLAFTREEVELLETLQRFMEWMG
jgi:hypothetical protein